MQIIQGDCLEYLRAMPDKSFDLLLTDPPYGIHADRNLRANKQHGKALAPSKDYGAKDWDRSIPSPAVFSEMIRVSRNQIIFGGNYFTAYLPPSSCWIVWDKDNGNNGYADCELVWTSFKTAVRKVKWRWHGMLQEDMKNKDVRYHPTQKPLGVLKWIIDRYSKPFDTIIDPFLGSGTTAVAAAMLGRDCIGIERDPEYVAIARTRLAQIQPSLHFTNSPLIPPKSC